MKKIILLIFIALCLIPAMLYAADKIDGKIQGFNCVTQGRCPISSYDPLVTTEPAFVVVTPDNKYYFISNVSRGILAPLCTEKVSIKGDFNGVYNEVDASSITLIHGDKPRIVWNRDYEFNPPPVLHYRDKFRK